MSNDHEIKQSDDLANEELTKRYPHGQYGTIFSVVLLVLASMAGLILFEDSLTTAYSFFLLFLFVAATAVLILRLPRLRGAIDELSKSGVSVVATPSRRKSIMQSFLLLMASGLYIYLPLALAGVLPPLYWISPLMGIIAGINLGELVHTTYARRWEQNHDGNLFITYLYQVDYRGKPRLKTISLRLRRSGE